MAAVFVAAVIVAFTWLATVRWARFGDTEPDGIATTGPRRALDAPLAAEQPASDSNPTTTPQRRTQPHEPSWARTDKEAA